MKKNKNEISWFNTREVIGKRIRDLRDDEDLKQDELGNILGVCGTTIGRIERGEKLLDVEMAAAISNHFEISCDELLRGTKPEYYNIERATGLTEETAKSINLYSKKYKYLIDLLNVIFSLDSKEGKMLLHALYIYASTHIDDISIQKSSLITSLEKSEFEIKKQALWSTVEMYVRTAFDKMRYDFSDNIHKLDNIEANKLVAEIMQDRKDLKERVDTLEDSYYGLDFDKSELQS